MAPSALKQPRLNLNWMNTGKPTGVYVKERKDAHKLIEDFMLLANRKGSRACKQNGQRQA
jgi:exoribonuclease R